MENDDVYTAMVTVVSRSFGLLIRIFTSKGAHDRNWTEPSTRNPKPSANVAFIRGLMMLNFSKPARSSWVVWQFFGRNEHSCLNKRLKDVAVMLERA